MKEFTEDGINIAKCVLGRKTNVGGPRTKKVQGSNTEKVQEAQESGDDR